MGITGFFKIENVDKKQLKDVGIDIKLNDISGQTIGCDALYFIYSSILANPNMCDTSGNKTAHLNTILMKILMYNKHNIKSIWIFDNPNRNVSKKERVNSFRIDSNIVSQTMDLLSYLGVEYRVVGPGEEAEHYGAHLCITGEISYFMSGDSDVLAFGGKLIKPVHQKNKTVYILYLVSDVLKFLDIDMVGLTKISVIMGNDFCDKTPKIGVKTVIKKYNDVILTPEQSAVMADIYLKEFDDGNVKKTIGSYNKDCLIDMLKKHSFKEERLINLIPD